MTDRLAAATFDYAPPCSSTSSAKHSYGPSAAAPPRSCDDIQKAKMTEEIGLAQPVEYTGAERRTIATHEAGHATVAYLAGKSRKLETNRHLVEALRDALLDRDELVGDEILTVVAGAAEQVV